MKYLFLILLLVSCSDKLQYIDISQFTEKCQELARDVGADAYNIRIEDVEEETYTPVCSLNFQKSTGVNSIAYWHHKFNEKELNAIQWYRNNKKSI